MVLTDKPPHHGESPLRNRDHAKVRGNGLAFLIGAAVYWLTHRIEEAELNTRDAAETAARRVLREAVAAANGCAV